jgi:hypothetical protein
VPGEPGSRATGQPGNRAAGQPGSRATGQPGVNRGTGDELGSRAIGRRARARAGARLGEEDLERVHRSSVGRDVSRQSGIGLAHQDPAIVTTPDSLPRMTSPIGASHTCPRRHPLMSSGPKRPSGSFTAETTSGSFSVPSRSPDGRPADSLVKSSVPITRLPTAAGRRRPPGCPVHGLPGCPATTFIIPPRHRYMPHDKFAGKNHEPHRRLGAKEDGRRKMGPWMRTAKRRDMIPAQPRCPRPGLGHPLESALRPMKVPVNGRGNKAPGRATSAPEETMRGASRPGAQMPRTPVRGISYFMGKAHRSRRGGTKT